MSRRPFAGSRYCFRARATPGRNVRHKPRELRQSTSGIRRGHSLPCCPLRRDDVRRTGPVPASQSKLLSPGLSLRNQIDFAISQGTTIRVITESGGTGSDVLTAAEAARRAAIDGLFDPETAREFQHADRTAQALVIDDAGRRSSPPGQRFRWRRQEKTSEPAVAPGSLTVCRLQGRSIEVKRVRHSNKR